MNFVKKSEKSRRNGRGFSLLFVRLRIDPNRLKCNPSTNLYLMYCRHSWHRDPVDVDVDTDPPQHPDDGLAVRLLDTLVEDNFIRKSDTSHSWLSSGEETGSSWHVGRMSISEGFYSSLPCLHLATLLIITITFGFQSLGQIFLLLSLSQSSVDCEDRVGVTGGSRWGSRPRVHQLARTSLLGGNVWGCHVRERSDNYQEQVNYRKWDCWQAGWPGLVRRVAGHTGHHSDDNNIGPYLK